MAAGQWVNRHGNRREQAYLEIQGWENMPRDNRAGKTGLEKTGLGKQAVKTGLKKQAGKSGLGTQGWEHRAG
jgi:hypothetical protein